MSRRLSTWGWGWEDRFPDRETRRLFAKQVRQMTGFELDSVEEPVPLAEASIPDARIAIPDSLAKMISADPRARATRAQGRGYRDIVRGFAGHYASAPDVVVHPQDEEDVRRALDWADSAGLTVVPYGGGTSVVGGVEVTDRSAHKGVVCLDMRSMDAVNEVDTLSMAARIQAGATGPRLEEQLRGRGLTMRFFPQSFELSTLGGWIATRAGGHFATLYTHIDDVLSSVRMLSPRGEFLTRRLPASGAGPDPNALVLGSEGTLGVITEAWVNIRRRPVWRARASVRFTSFTDAVSAARCVAQSGLHPSNCRLLDRHEALLNRVATDGSHVLLLGFESADHPVETWMTRALEIAAENGGVCRDGPTLSHRPTEQGQADDDAVDRWRAAFLEAPYLVNSMVSLGVLADTFETACTWDRFDAMHAAISHDVHDAMQRVAGGGMLTCRFTHVYPDGPAPYFTFIAPAKRGSELRMWAEIKHAASEAIERNGGTITHHHAVGRVHRPWFEREQPAGWDNVLRAVKGEFDPRGLLNPGALFSTTRPVVD
ncbi:MAG: FAD-binding oxidoreductase [Sandaracinaceae bacterium]